MADVEGGQNGRPPTRDELAAALAERDRELAQARAERDAALERQTATSEILSAIAAAPDDAVRALQLIAETSARLFGAPSVSIQLAEGLEFVREYRVGAAAQRIGSAYPRSNIKVGGRNLPGTVVAQNRQIHIPDLDHLDPSMFDWPGLPHARAGGTRTLCGTPLRREGKAFGVLIVFRDRLLPFTDEELALQQTFADQAAIAIENSRLIDEVQAKTRDLAARNLSYSEQIEHQSATIEILKAMSASQGDAQPVFDVIVQRAMHICNADIAVVLAYDGAQAHLRAISVDPSSTPPEVVTAYRGLFPQPPSRASVALRAIFQGRVIHIPDMAEDPDLSQASRDIGRKGALAIPLLRDGQVIGSIGLSAKVTGGFSTAQIELLKTFAEQAVIAIRSAETFRALNTRTGELSEALQQQTATADVLKVISGSVFDLQKVLDTLVDSAVELSGSKFVILWLMQDGLMHGRAFSREDRRAEFVDFMRAHPQAPGRATTVARVALTGEVQNIVDATQDEEIDADLRRTMLTRGTLGVPMKRDGRVIGAIVLSKMEAGPYPQRIVELIETFADQAVIAIENARLFEEVQAKTRDLEESLAFQIATSDVLAAIGSSMADARPVFQRIVNSLARLLEHKHIGIWIAPGDGLLHIGALKGPNSEVLEQLYPTPIEGTTAPIVLQKGQQVFYPDVLHGADVPASLKRAAATDFDNFSDVLTPMMWNGRGVGMIAMTRAPNASFSERELSLLRTFADQAVIAIENARLFNEVQAKTRDLEESLAFQIATSDVLAAIGASMSDPQQVFNRIADTALRLMPETGISLFLLPGDGLAHLAAQRTAFDISPYYPVRLPEQAMTTLREKQQHYLPHILGNLDAAPHQVRIAEAFRDFALIDTAMVWGGRIVGFISAARQPHKVFSEREFQILKTFADQAVIAIQNADLFNQVQAKTSDLEVSLERQTATSEILRVISESPTDARPVFDAIVVTARRVLHCELAFMILCDNAEFWTVAGATPEGLVAPEFLPPKTPLDPRLSFPARAIVDRERLHVPDWSAIELPEHDREVGRVVGVQSSLYLPLLRSGECIGALALGGRRPNIFGENEIALAESFRDQALIAIENARLFNETKEALERQLATSRILEVIASSPADAAPVFEAIAESANAVMRGRSTGVYRFIGDTAHLMASTSTSPEADATLRATFPLALDDFPLFARVREGYAQIPDTEEADDIRIRDLGRARGYRSLLLAPLVHLGRPIGLISVTRRDVGGFTAADVAQLRSFADQAVIAIENARLFEEVQAKTSDLEVSLERQTATSEILRVISESPTNAKPVFDAIVVTAARLLHCDFAWVMLTDGQHWWSVAAASPDGLVPILIPDKNPVDPTHNFPARAIVSKAMLYLPDWTRIELPEFQHRVQTGYGVNCSLSLPLLRNGECIGLLTLSTRQANAFRPADIEQAESFRDQALIAMENARLFRETQEALERQTATAEILKVIASSPGNTKPVFDSIAASAKRLLRGGLANVTRFVDGKAFLAAYTPTNAEADAALESFFPRDQRDPIFRALEAGRAVQVADTEGADPWSQREIARQGGWRSAIVAPLLSDGAPIGSIFVSRPQPGAFVAEDVQLLQTFADQAVIAIQNARLFNDTKEALERQTATAEILKVIASSRADVQPVFDAIARSAAQLCEGANSGVFLLRDGRIHIGGSYGLSRQQLEIASQAYPAPLDRGLVAGRAILDRSVAHISDIATDPQYTAEANVRAGFRSAVSVPMLRHGEPFGAINVTREEARPFAAAQIELLKTFADQAVIAIENTRLFNETQESLERQTATSEILRVISQSPTDLRPVLDVIAETAARLCGSDMTLFFRYDGELFRILASWNFSPEAYEMLERRRLAPGHPSAIGQAGATLKPAYIPDILQVAGYGLGPEQNSAGMRATLAVPLLREGRLIGALSLNRNEPASFSPKQIELVEMFADQAAIAIENFRLFEEVQAKTRDLTVSLERQTATSDILRVISESPTDAQPVFDRIVLTAVQLLRSNLAFVIQTDGKQFWSAALASPEGLVPLPERAKRPVDAAGNFPSRAIVDKAMLYVPDWSRIDLPEHERWVQTTYGVNCSLYLPLLRDGECIGLIVLTNRNANAFDPSDIALAESFRDQALIAIENARLFNETQEALERQTATAEILRVISQSPTDARPVFERIVETALRVLRCQAAGVLLRDGDFLQIVAIMTPAGLDAEVRRAPIRLPIDPNDNFPSRAVLRKEMLHLPDWSLIEDIPEHERHMQERVGIRTTLYLPLLREMDCIGVIVLTGNRPNLFGPKEIAQAESFRDQALIAIENARLFNETQEALERQTATAEILKVIAGSPDDTQPVFKAIVTSAKRLLGGRAGFLTRFIGDKTHLAAFTAVNPDDDAAVAAAFPRPADDPITMALKARRMVLVEDTESDDDWGWREGAQMGIRAGVNVPLISQGTAIGGLTITRSEPGAFDQDDLELLRTFADQAVIAIENTRLLNDTKQALERQTATAEILKVIASSPDDTQPVFEAIVTSAKRLLGGRLSLLTRFVGEEAHLAAFTPINPTLDAALAAAFPRVSDDPVATELRAGRTALIEDAETEDRWGWREGARQTGFRSAANVPLISQGATIGGLTVNSADPRAFAPDDVELLRTFADQAVIAIENTRLLNDTKEALERQTATAEILKVISASPTSAKPVFQAITLTAVRLFRCQMSGVWLLNGDLWLPEAAATPEGPVPEREYAPPMPLDPTANFPSQAALARKTRLVTDYTGPDTPPHERWLGEHFGIASSLFLPLTRGEQCIGMFMLTSTRKDTFDAKAIALAESFRDQAQIAVENTRLFRETQESLEQLKASADILGVISNSVADTQPVFDKILQSAKHLFGGDELDVLLVDGDGQLTIAAYIGEFHDVVAETFPAPVERTPAGLAIRERKAVHWPDLVNGEDVPGVLRKMAKLIGYRSMVFAPMLKGDRGIGAIGVARSTGPFNAKELAMLQTFADQAVIAIENARLFNETQEALAQQTATADVLKVISRSVFDLQAVFDTLLTTAVELVGGVGGAIALREGDQLRFRAGSSPQGYLRTDFVGRLIEIDRSSVAGRATATGQTEYIPDAAVDPEFRAQASGAWGKSYLGVPLTRDGRAEGALTIIAAKANAFTPRHIELIQTFADQAVIAIKNVSLFDEVQARTRDLQESLERQQASAEILRVISSSPTDVKPVFDAISLTAARLFQCDVTGVFRVEGHSLTAIAASFADRLFEPHEFAPDMPLEAGHNFPALAAVEKRTVYVPDYRVAGTPEHERYISERYGLVCGLFLPLMRKDECIGVFLLTTHEPNRFDARDIALAESFRDQAQIAIDNTRLFNETQEALAQQTATADVLKVISRSAFDLKSVLSTLVDSASLLCAAPQGAIMLRDGDVVRLAEQKGYPEDFVAHLLVNPLPVGPYSGAGRAAYTGEVAHFPDILADPDYRFSGGQRLGGYRALLSVPLLREKEVIGVFSLGRPTPGPFTERQIELVRTFADQAVIAIENVRLFDEVQARTRDLAEALQVQTATADVLQVISRSAFDLQKVLDTLISSAVTLCGADNGLIYLQRGDAFYLRAHFNPDSEPAFLEKLKSEPQRPGRSSVGGRVLLTGEIVHIPDNRLDPDYDPALLAVTVNRAVLGVPLKRDGAVVGAIALARRTPGLFTDRQIGLAQTFANQAVIAIENARLLDEVQARTRELEQSLDDLRKAQDRLVQTEKLASLGQLTAGIAHEIKNPLNFVNNFFALSRELLEEMKEALSTPPLPEPQRDDVEDLMAMIDGNLEKVVHHGKRADSIVKNMLLHSREGSSARERLDVNHLVEEAMNLAYHGARVEKPGFNVTIEKRLDPQAGAIEGFAQELTRVLLNLVGNGFYATQKRKAAEVGVYEPTIVATTRNLGDAVEIAIRDNGTGIPDEVKAKMFNPFFTTKPAGEGTGLGLSLSYDIIVKQHGGAIEVATEPGAFTQFTIRLPRAGAEGRA